MDKLNYFLYCLFIYLSGFSFPSFADDKCVQKSHCSCEFSNGTGIDLSNSTLPSFYDAQSFKTNMSYFDLFTYYFHPCFNIPPVVNGTSPGGGCVAPMTLFRQTTSMSKINSQVTTYCEYMGNTDVTTFADDGSYLIHTNGPSHTLIKLVCAQTDDKLGVTSIEEPNNIILSFYSRNSCLRQIEDISTRSTGSTLLIIFFSLVILYLVLGVCTKKFLMGATGIEVVPNLAFWSDLPNLVKDGWSFAVSGCRLPPRGGPGPATSPDPNSYDSI